MANANDLIGTLVRQEGFDGTRAKLREGEDYLATRIIEWIGLEEALLRLNQMEVEDPSFVFDPSETESCERYIDAYEIKLHFDDDPRFQGWGMSWWHGTMSFGFPYYTERQAKQVVALFAYLYNKGVDVSLALNLTVGYFKMCAAEV